MKTSTKCIRGFSRNGNMYNFVNGRHPRSVGNHLVWIDVDAVSAWYLIFVTCLPIHNERKAETSYA